MGLLVHMIVLYNLFPFLFTLQSFYLFRNIVWLVL